MIYQPDKHQVQMLKWLKQWNLSPTVLDLLPPTGIIKEEKGACFFYKTNSKLGFIECLIVEKELAKQERELVLNELVANILDWMVEDGCQYAASYSSNPQVVARAIDFGFTVNTDSYQCFVKGLK